MLGIRDSGFKIPVEGLLLYWDASQLRSFVSGTRQINNLMENQTFTGSFFSGSSGIFPFYTGSGGGAIYITQQANPAAGVVSSQFTASVSSSTIVTFTRRVGAQFADVPIVQAFGPTTGIAITYFAAGNSVNLIWAQGLFRDGSAPFLTSSLYYMVAGSGTATSQKLYINKTVFNFSASRTVPVSVTRASMGTSNVGSSTNYQGDVALMLLYNRQLSDAEVFQIYDSFKPRFPNLP